MMDARIMNIMETLVDVLVEAVDDTNFVIELLEGAGATEEEIKELGFDL